MSDTFSFAELCVLDVPFEVKVDSDSECEEIKGVVTVEMFDRAMAIYKSGKSSDFTLDVISGEFGEAKFEGYKPIPLNELTEDELILRKMISEGRLTFVVD